MSANTAMATMVSSSLIMLAVLVAASSWQKVELAKIEAAKAQVIDCSSKNL